MAYLNNTKAGMTTAVKIIQMTKVTTTPVTTAPVLALLTPVDESEVLL
jgi:hypothetical protein